MIRALLFDLDGTLADTEEANYVAYAQAFEEVGRSLSRTQYRQAFGLRFDGLVAQVAPDLSTADRERVRASKARHYQGALERVRPNKPLIDLLRSVRSLHRTALVTTSARANAEAVLRHLDLGNEWFDAHVFGEDVHAGKPDPECYRIAIARLGVPPEECLVFEDSDVGIQAAEAAGAHVTRVRA